MGTSLQLRRQRPLKVGDSFEIQKRDGLVVLGTAGEDAEGGGVEVGEEGVEPVRGVGRDEVEVGEEEGKVERLTGLDADAVKNEKTTAPAKSESG